ncbi:PF11026 domain protein [Leptospira kirschneri str. 2008720114]|nr:PF11026 domain protein [Leptospira kirschneri str. 2008720114]
MDLKKNETLRKDDLFDSSSLMNPLSFNTPGLLFPAISLLMLAYTNRFLGLASLSRQLIGKFQENQNPDLLPQIRNLRFRLSLIRHTQSSGILSLLACTSCLPDRVSLRSSRNRLEPFRNRSIFFSDFSLYLSLRNPSFCASFGYRNACAI